MKFALQSSSGGYQVKAYSAGELILSYMDTSRLQKDITDQQQAVIKEEKLNHSIVIAPDQLIRDWPPATFADLDRTHLNPVSELKPEVILLGTGQQLKFPDMRWIQDFHRLGIGFEVMDTAAACRTYNILTAEDRYAVAALILN